MYNCSLQEIDKYKQHCYLLKKTPTLLAEYGAVKFASVEHAVEMIRHILIPVEQDSLANTTWTLAEANTLLLKEVTFEAKEDAELYQEAVERAWALGGHLDPRVEQSYYE